MWWLVVFLLSPVGGSLYVREASFPNRSACLTAQAKFTRTLSTHHIAARTGCVRE